MRFLQTLFGGARNSESVILIDIGARMVAGGYVHFSSQAAPRFIYEYAVPVEAHEGESLEDAMLRAVTLFGETLVREGAGSLRRATGSGSVSGVVVSIGAPWQRTSVRNEYLEEKKPFLFSKRVVAAVLQKTRVQPPGKVLVDEEVIGTIVNGYSTHDPYGKAVHRAEIIILTSYIDDVVARGVTTALRRVFHTHHVLLVAGSSLRYQAMRAIFPHEREALILDVTGPLTTVSLVHSDLCVSMHQIDDNLETLAAWRDRVTAELVDLAKLYPLPRTIFLLARDPDCALLEETLKNTTLGELWLAENQPTIVPLRVGTLSDFFVQGAESTPPDVLLVFMAVYWEHRPKSVAL